MSKITWYERPKRFTVTLVPRSTLSYDAALARIAELEAAIADTALARISELEATIVENGHSSTVPQNIDRHEQAKDMLRAVHASVASPAPAKKQTARKPRAPLDDSVKAIVLRTKTTEDGTVTHYVKSARKASETWYPVWSSISANAAEFPHQEALDLVSWLKKSRMVDRSYTYSLEKIDA